MRISTNHFYSNVLGSIQKEYLGGARAHEQIASGLRINRLSEDPSALSQILSLRTSNNEIENYLLSIDQQISRLNRAEEALARAGETMLDVRDVAVEGATGTFTPQDLKNLAFQVDQTITAIVGFANTTLGRIRPDEMFTRGTVVLEAGTDGELVEQGIVAYKPPVFGHTEGVDGEGWGRVLTLHMLVSTIDPETVFGRGEPGVLVDGQFMPVEETEDGGYQTVGTEESVETEDIVYRATMFDTLFELRDLLEHGKLPGGDGEHPDPLSTRISNLLTDFDKHRDTLVQGRSDLGSRAYQLEKLSNQVGVQKEQLTEVLAKVGDTDVAEAMVRLSRHDLVLRATLLTATRLMDVSLLNYLR